MGVVGTIAGGLLGLFGVLCLVGAAGGARQFVNYRRASLTAGRDVADGDLVGVRGTVDDAGGLESPLTGTPCVAYEWQMEQYDRAREHHDWETKVDTGDLEQFRLLTDDGTRATVVPADGLDPSAQLEFSNHTEVFRLQADETPPGPVQRLIDRGIVEPNEETLGTELHNEYRPGADDDTDDLPAELDTINADHRERRYLERTVTDGDEIYVYGEAERAGEGLRLTEGALFAISDSDVQTLARRYAILAAVIAMTGLFALVFAWGLLT